MAVSVVEVLFLRPEVSLPTLNVIRSYPLHIWRANRQLETRLTSRPWQRSEKCEFQSRSNSHRRIIGRRSVLRAAATGLAGLAGAALLGCSEEMEQVETVQPTRLAPTPTPWRNKPGIHDGPVPTAIPEFDPRVNAKRGGTLRMRYLEPPHLDINRTLSCTTYHPLSYSLSRLARARTGALADPLIVEIEPDLAESWSMSPDATEFVFRLRKGVKTHNKAPVLGREFTSEDVRLSWERYQAGGSQTDIYASLKDIVTPDDHTIVARLNEPQVEFVTSIAAWSYLWPYELIDDENLLARDAIGTGPFVLEEWVPESHTTFSRHPEYFEPGLPYVDEVILSPETDRASAVSRFISHDLFDIDVGLSDAELSELIERAPDTAIGFRFPRTRGANVNGWHFQLDNPLFEDDRIRRAISLAFDRAGYDRARNGGDNEHPEGPFSNAPMPWPFLFSEYPTAAANGQWYRYDPSRASQLMQAAGYTADNRLDFEIESHYFPESFSNHIVPGIGDSLREVNIRYRNIDQQTYTEMLSKRRFDAAIGIQWGPPGYSMDQWIWPWWHSRGGLNFNNVNDTELDLLLDQQRGEVNQDSRRDLWRKIWELLHDRVYDIWWPEAHTRGAQHNYVMNMRWHALIGSYLCYSSDQAREIWLDDGAPGLDR